MEKMKYVCEICGKNEIMTPEEAYQEGWDYSGLNLIAHLSIK